MAVVVGAVAVAGWPVIVARSAPGPLLLVPLLAHVAGMLAGYGVLVLVGLMARVPVLEHGIGADRMTRWHRVVAPAVMALIVIHAWAATSACRKLEDERYLYIAPISWKDGKPVIGLSLRPQGERG